MPSKPGGRRKRGGNPLRRSQIWCRQQGLAAQEEDFAERDPDTGVLRGHLPPPEPSRPPSVPPEVKVTTSTVHLRGRRERWAPGCLVCWWWHHQLAQGALWARQRHQRRFQWQFRQTPAPRQGSTLDPTRVGWTPGWVYIEGPQPVAPALPPPPTRVTRLRERSRSPLPRKQSSSTSSKAAPGAADSEFATVTVEAEPKRRKALRPGPVTVGSSWACGPSASAL